jgi:hypothetical protein
VPSRGSSRGSPIEGVPWRWSPGGFTCKGSAGEVDMEWDPWRGTLDWVPWSFPLDSVHKRGSAGGGPL